jgi:signal transduction histidine kinase
VRAERARIGRELHDGVIQALYALGLGLESALQDLEADVPAARSRLIRARDTINNVTAEVRAYVGELRAEAGPGASLASRFGGVGAELGLNLTVEVAARVERALTPAQREEVYRIGREALTNVAKHARATRVRLRLGPGRGPRADGWVLAVRDDGVGFAAGRAAPLGLGLRTMRERAEGLGAEFRVTARPGGGTVVRVTGR